MAGLWAPDGLDARTPAVTLGSGLTFTVPSGLAGYLRGFRYRNTSAQSKTGAANVNSNPRIDTLALRLDRAANSILPVILQGTPAPSPVPKTPVQTDTLWEMPIYKATCPGSASAQNYSALTPMWWPVSSERGRHEWTASASVGSAGTTFSAWTAVAGNSSIASISAANLLLNVPGRWSITLEAVSDGVDAGQSTIEMSWTNGAWRSGFRRDQRTRFSGTPAGGGIAQTIEWTGIVLAPEDDQPITTSAVWRPIAGDPVTYGMRLSADYLGG